MLSFSSLLRLGVTFDVLAYKRENPIGVRMDRSGNFQSTFRNTSNYSHSPTATSSWWRCGDFEHLHTVTSSMQCHSDYPILQVPSGMPWGRRLSEYRGCEEWRWSKHPSGVRAYLPWELLRWNIHVSLLIVHFDYQHGKPILRLIRNDKRPKGKHGLLRLRETDAGNFLPRRGAGVRAWPFSNLKSITA